MKRRPPIPTLFPYKTLLRSWKVATTLDGRVAAVDGTSRWITGPAARAEVHRLRAGCDAVLVGSGTALADDPQLTVRDEADRKSKRLNSSHANTSYAVFCM